MSQKEKTKLVKASDNVKKIDNGWDEAVAGIRNLNPAACDSFVASYKNSHLVLFHSGSQIKNNSSELLLGTDKIMTGVSSWGGSYGDPDQFTKKIHTNVKNITEGIATVSKTLKEMADGFFNAVSPSNPAAGAMLRNTLGETVNMAEKLSVASSVTQVGSTGIGTFYHIKDSFVQDNSIASKAKQSIETKEGTVTGGAALINANVADNILNGSEETSSSTPKSSTTQSSFLNESVNGGGEDDYSSDMILEINVVLEGYGSSKNSMCNINGTKYRLSGYSISQELLQPMILSFSVEKDDKTETQADVVFEDATQLIGKSFEIDLTTTKSSNEKNIPNRQKIKFKGIIIDVSASRVTASSQSASITVASMEALLQSYPHCRSFEEMTLKDIVGQVLSSYREVKSIVSPRFKEKIPYIVQYNQSDYGFIKMLAIRFGEWMYSDGENLIFGELTETNVTIAKLDYPDRSLMSFSLQQNLDSFSFKHILTDHYQYGEGNEIRQESSKGLASEKVNNTWTELAYEASVKRFANEPLTVLTSGGFDNGKDDEGADEILDYSLRIEALGKKTGLMTVQGFSKLSMLKIGQSFLIRDNAKNKPTTKEDINQQVLKVLGINHSFSYQQDYANSFTAIPVSCIYPPYAEADTHTTSASQRAKVVDNKDEKKLGRIRVQFPWQEAQDKNMKSPWLRIVVPYAGESKGHQFIPEIGEEVLIGFEMNNIERPYVMGMLYNGGKGKPDKEWAAIKEEKGTTNNIKAIRTRNGHSILFNDRGETGLMEIYDNKGNTYHITLSAEEKKITVYSAGDIEVNAGSNITVNAKGSVAINADQNISMDAKGEISIQANCVKVR